MFSQKTTLEETISENLLQNEDKEAQSYVLSPTRNVLFRWKLLTILSTIVSLRPPPPLLLMHSDSHVYCECLSKSWVRFDNTGL